VIGLFCVSQNSPELGKRIKAGKSDPLTEGAEGHRKLAALRRVDD